MSSEPRAQDAGTAAPGASAAAGKVAFIVSGTKPDPHRDADSLISASLGAGRAS